MKIEDKQVEKVWHEIEREIMWKRFKVFLLVNLIVLASLLGAIVGIVRYPEWLQVPSKY